MSVTSAGAPTDSVPRSRLSRRAGLAVSSSIKRRSEIASCFSTSKSWNSAELGFEAEDAERRLVELDLLLVAAVRRVVAGKHGDRAIGDAADERIDVAPASAAAGSF